MTRSRHHGQHQATRHRGFRKGHVLGCRAERDGAQIEAQQQIGHRLANPPIVIDDEHDGVVGLGHPPDRTLAAREQVAIFDDDLKQSRRVTLAEWDSRPWSDKLLDALAGTLSSQF
jgi:hypothetical protein